MSTVPLFIFTLLRTQVEAIRDSGAAVTVITSPDEDPKSFKPIENCDFKAVPIAREISLFADVVSLIRLIKLFRAERFDIVHSNTPKAGLLCAIAGKLAGIPIRIHTFTGQTWATIGGVKRLILKFCDKLIGHLNTSCYADSPSQRDFLINSKIIKENKISILGSGSLAGVDITRFNQENFTDIEKTTIRESLNISKDQLVLLFVGRVTKEKGIFELIDAFAELLKCHIDIILLVVGPFEQNIEQEIKIYSNEKCGDKVIFSGFSVEPEKFIAIADILCLPSYREGFGTVVIEAAAMGVPTVGTKIYGLTDAVVDKQTGLLVEPRNIKDLTIALNQLIEDPQLRLKLGQNAKMRALNEFDSRKFDTFVISEYEKLLAGNHH
ncbi:Glycosyl transferases group 1-like protein [Legionella hackeliae]|uniref:Glycosyl transferases group 1-like protein n=1 Tax=Legionella hackeliae TaxID=449 RepID=A0A0A8UU10_LEGHA|nr:glycosyl transferase, group 1 [Legionella hackeliae]CEK10249.1 Glycosyl transferases group 1-like protein [Legionella hackeliae]